jgi:hypothetical protein
MRTLCDTYEDDNASKFALVLQIAILADPRHPFNAHRDLFNRNIAIVLMNRFAGGDSPVLELNPGFRHSTGKVSAARQESEIGE